MRIAVAGGTGTTGRPVVEEIRAAGDEAVVIARKTGVDLVTGRGLTAKLDGVDAVIDVTNILTFSAAKSIRFFEAATTNLLAAERQVGTPHHVVLSIVGCDRVDIGYYRGKRRQEELVRNGSAAATVLRATQFHEFAAQTLDRNGLLVFAPKLLSRPVAVTEVAQHLVAIARGEPLGKTLDLAGPEQCLWMDDMVKRLAKARGERRPVIGFPLLGRVGKQIAGGGLLPAGAGPRGSITFDDWLREQVNQS